MKVLFIASGNHGEVSPIVKNQGEALASEGVDVEYYLIRGRGIIGYLRNVRPIREHLHTHHYNAVHAHFSLSAFAASIAGAKPLVVSLMGDDVKAAFWYRLTVRIFAWIFRWKALIVKSKDMYSDLGIKRAIVIPNGVNMERFQPMDKAECRKRLKWKEEKGKKHILFPADATRPVKNYALAEAAVERVRELVSEEIRDVELHAFENTPNAETPYWYNAADVVLMTSKWEGSPNAIKEAMACSRPIVCTNVGDVAERMRGVEGTFVAQSREPQEIAQLLKQAMACDSTSGRERIIADGLDAHEINKKLISVYM